MATARSEKLTARFVSVKTLAQQWDCSRTAVNRMLQQAGVQAFYFGQGRNGAKRYRVEDVERFLSTIEKA
jgi:biotin operon repressor